MSTRMPPKKGYSAKIASNTVKDETKRGKPKNQAITPGAARKPKGKRKS